MSIASAIQDLSARIQDAYSALSNKGATMPAVRNSANLSATIDTIQGGGGSVVLEYNDVMFKDIDGNTVYSCTSQEALDMTAMPTCPEVDGYDSLGWNYTLQQMKETVSDTGHCNIGALYTPTGGKTTLVYDIESPKYTTLSIQLAQTVADGIEFNWGDGTPSYTYNSPGTIIIIHTYHPSTYPQRYTVSFDVKSGKMAFPGNIGGLTLANQNDTQVLSAAHVQMLKEVHLGNNLTAIGQYAFLQCVSLNQVTFANESLTIGNYAFAKCYNLRYACIPGSIINMGGYMFNGSLAIGDVSIGYGVQKLGVRTLLQTAVKYLALPTSLTSLEAYQNQDNRQLKAAWIPNTVTDVSERIFNGCYSLEEIKFTNNIANHTLDNYTFQGCLQMKSVVIPDDITNLGSYMFGLCHALQSITFPSNLASIGANDFNSCYTLRILDFRKAQAVPTLANVNAFTSTPTDREIIVPDSLYASWVGSGNWASSTNNIVGSIVKASESSLGPLT